MALNELTISEASSGLRTKKFSATELAQACLDATKLAAPLNATIHVDEERTLADAKAADARISSGDATDLTGIPIATKDLFCVKGQPAQSASKILEGFVPSYESTITEKLWNSGAVYLGATNMDEFGMGSSTTSSCYGPAINPWRIDKDLSPGGSSGGSAAAVGADTAIAAIATDTGGSIRQPAAFTGTVGIKPTYGRCSRYGIIAYASSLDQAGPITKSVEDAAIMLNSMCGYDAKDSTSLNVPTPDFTTEIGNSIKGKRIGIPKEYRIDGLPSEIDSLWSQGADMLRDLGAEIVDISLPMTKYALAAYYVIAPAESSSNLARYDGVRYGKRADVSAQEGIHDMYAKTRAEGFGSEVKRRIMMGTYVLSAGFYDAYYIRAQKIRSLIKADFDKVFNEGLDAILSPITPSPAFATDSAKSTDPVQMYLNDIFTITLNMAGLPGISVPAGLSQEGLPLGLQLIGRPLAETSLLSLAHALESQVQFNQKPNKWWIK